ncbi:hypothetical protein JCM10296v2_005799 [Rhodotorula toruloides]
MATLIPANTRMITWVQGVLDELRPLVGDQQFNAWLVAGNRQKIPEIALMLQSRGDPHSANYLPTKNLTKTIKAFLTSVFYLKLSLANLGGSSPAAYLVHAATIHTFVSCIQHAKVNTFGTTEEQRAAVALDLSGFIATRQEQLLTIWYTIISGHSLLKPTIGRRVALMHGTTKARWERGARAF